MAPTCMLHSQEASLICLDWYCCLAHEPALQAEGWRAVHGWADRWASGGSWPGIAHRLALVTRAPAWCSSASRPGLCGAGPPGA